MSEPIQSISQGNYILQGTVATSAGIVGDGSTQNPLRADETVLWSGNLNSPSSISLNDYSNNYEKIGFYMTEQGGFKEIKYFPGDSTMYGLNLTVPYAANVASTIIRYGIFSSTNYKDYNYTAVGRILITTGNNSVYTGSQSGPYITKIIGINRISG